MTRIAIKNLRPGHRTEMYTVTSTPSISSIEGRVEVSVHVRYIDGGDGVRTWDNPNIEIEVMNA
jgi:hypothetical protein